jgi:hypothetical protein
MRCFKKALGGIFMRKLRFLSFFMAIVILALTSVVGVQAGRSIPLEDRLDTMQRGQTAQTIRLACGWVVGAEALMNLPVFESVSDDLAKRAIRTGEQILVLRPEKTDTWATMVSGSGNIIGFIQIFRHEEPALRFIDANQGAFSTLIPEWFQGGYTTTVRRGEEAVLAQVNEGVKHLVARIPRDAPISVINPDGFGVWDWFIEYPMKPGELYFLAANPEHVGTARAYRLNNRRNKPEFTYCGIVHLSELSDNQKTDGTPYFIMPTADAAKEMTDWLVFVQRSVGE